MIENIVHVPKIYEAAQAGAGDSYYYSEIIHLLEDIKNYGILLNDSQRVMMPEIHRLLDGWRDVNKRRLAKGLLTQLVQTNRVKSVDAPPDTTRALPGCQHAFGISQTLRPFLLVTPDSCACSGTCTRGMGATHSLQVGAYVEHPCRNYLQSLHDVTIDSGRWDKNRFENEILTPIFRYASKVTIIDRLIGHHLQDMIRDRSSVSVRTNYSNSISWIYGHFLQVVSNRSDAVFEIVCGLSPGFSDSDMACVYTVLQQYASNLKQTTNSSNLTIIVKKQRTSQDFPHDRYLFTNQISLHIGPGVDLLLSSDPNRIRKATISQISIDSRRTVNRQLDEMEDYGV